MRKITFWYEFASPYSYLTVMRIGEMAARAGVEVEWKPFLLGPIFEAQGWDTSPFNLFQSKGFYMVRDIERISVERGLKFRMPNPFPQDSVPAALLAIVGLKQGWTQDFSRGVFAAEFAEGKSISDRPLLAGILEKIGVDAEVAFAKADSPETRATLRAHTDQAQARGIFGAPNFTTEDRELFWGDDRLEQALRWAVNK